MLLIRPARLPGVSVLVGLFALACGARTSAEGSDAGVEPPQPCAVELDCDTGDACAPSVCREGICVALAPVTCDDHDACTEDSCDPQSGRCVFTPTTLDLDGDGHRAPKPGFGPGVPGACGDDCDDRSAAAHPGGGEVCDGVDNDCNGKVDDGAQYDNVQAPMRVSSMAFSRADGGGIAFDGKNYGITFSGHEQRWSSYFMSLAGSGMPVVPEKPLSDINSATYAGSLLHNGSYFASAWSDARQAGNYEIYFNRYDSRGQKLGPDVRVTNAPNFSLGATLAWNGKETILVWDDRRTERSGATEDIRLYGQRVAFDGSLIGENIPLTPAGTLAEQPSIALSKTHVGVLFTSHLPEGATHAKFLSTAPDLTQPSSLVDLGGTDVENPSLVYVGGYFVAFWERLGQNYGPSIYAMVVDENGAVQQSERAVTSGARFARSHTAVSLGDRVILIWADDHDGNYELYLQILDPSLNVLTPRTRLTFSAADTLGPAAALGPNGDLGVLFDDWQSGDRQTYFLGMGCSFPPGPK